MTLWRQSRLRPVSQFAIRMAIMIGMIIFIVSFHWIERDSLRDNIDGHVSFSDVIYFTMISATTTGYGDIVPVTDRARLFDALVVTPVSSSCFCSRARPTPSSSNGPGIGG